MGKKAGEIFKVAAKAYPRGIMGKVHQGERVINRLSWNLKGHGMQKTSSLGYS